MALDGNILGQLMFAASGALGAQALPIWLAYGNGVVNGLRTTVATGTLTGTAGVGKFTGIGALHGGSVAMLPIVATNLGPVLSAPPLAPAPSQASFFLAVSQIADYTLAALEVNGPSPGVGTGAGVIPPGGYVVAPPVIAGFIQAELIKIGLPPTPLQTAINFGIANSTQQIMALATTPLVVTGPVGPSPGAAPAVGIVS